MTDKSKKRFLITTIIGSFVVYSFIYYAHVFKIAPYNFKEFKSFTIRSGTRGNMVNYFNSLTGEYDYLDKKDSLRKITLHLTTADLDSLHRAATDLGFWDFQDNELNPDTSNPKYSNVPRYIIEYSYKRKTKRVLFDNNFSGPDKLVDANRSLITRIRYILSNAEERQRK